MRDSAMTWHGAESKGFRPSVPNEPGARVILQHQPPGCCHSRGIFCPQGKLRSLQTRDRSSDRGYRGAITSFGCTLPQRGSEIGQPQPEIASPDAPVETKRLITQVIATGEQGPPSSQVRSLPPLPISGRLRNQTAYRTPTSSSRLHPLTVVGHRRTSTDLNPFPACLIPAGHRTQEIHPATPLGSRRSGTHCPSLPAELITRSNTCPDCGTPVGLPPHEPKKRPQPGVLSGGLARTAIARDA